MLEETRAAIVRIEVVDGDRIVSRGTGCVVASRLILTALHVVADRSASPPRPLKGSVRVWFFGSSEPRPAVIVEERFDPQLDFVLLSCETNARALPLAELDRSHVAWETHGFSDANPSDGSVYDGEVSNADGRYGGMPAIQLFSKHAAAGNGAPVKGLSGAPCIVGGAVVGVIRSSLLDAGRNVAGTIYACPIGAVLEKCGDILPWPDPIWGLPGLPKRELPARPFRYLAPFEAEHAEVFFGRGAEIRDLYLAATSIEGPSIVLVYGQTGVGKSSILAAGLVPRLRSVEYFRRDTTKTLRAQLDGSSAEVVILDQAEEALDQVGELAAARRRVILGFRKEWLAEIERRLEGAGAVAKRFIEPLGRSGAIEAINGLLSSRRLRETYRLTIEDGLADVIASDVLGDVSSPAAPVLQILLTRMWELASPSAPRFDRALYEKARGDVRDFLARQLEVLRGERRELVDSGLALDLLLHHTTQGGTAAEHARDEVLAAYAHRREDASYLLKRLEDLYLLADAKNEAQAKRTRLAHDTLAPVVREESATSMAPGPRARRLLEPRVISWRKGATGNAFDAHDLGDVERGLDGMRALDADEERLVAASRESRASALRQRAMMLAMLIFAVTLVGFMGILNFLGGRERQANLAASKYQLGQAAGPDAVTALIHLADAFEQSAETDPRRAVYLSRFLNVARNAPDRISQIHLGAYNVYFDGSGNRALVLSSDGEQSVWNVPEGRVISSVQVPRTGPEMLAHSPPSLSPDGKRVTSLNLVWDADTGARIDAQPSAEQARQGGVERALPKPTIGSAVHANARISIAMRGGVVLGWKNRPYAGESLRLGTETASITDAIFDPDRRHLAVARRETLELFDLGGKRPWRVTYEPPLQSTTQLAFDHAGDRLAFAHDEKLELIDVRSGARTWPAPIRIGTYAQAVAFSQENDRVLASWMATLGTLQTAVWDARSGLALGASCSAPLEPLTRASFSSNGTVLLFHRRGIISARQGLEPCQYYRVANGGMLDALPNGATEPPPPANAEVFRSAEDVSPDGLWLLTSSVGEFGAKYPAAALRVWDLGTGTPLTDPIVRDRIVAAHFTADSRDLLLVTAGGTLERIPIAVTNAKPADWLSRAIRHLSAPGRNLTREEIDAFPQDRDALVTDLEQHRGDERADRLLELLRD